MWSWDQFRNLPRNQGIDPREQARQYFIHQSNMMMEAAANSNAVAAASAAGGSIKKEEEFTQYPFLTTKMRFLGVDFFDDPRFAPTPEELVIFPSVPEEIVSYYNDKIDAADNLNAYYRAVRDAFNKQENEINSYKSNIQLNISDPGPSLPYLKGKDKYPIGWKSNDPLYTEPSFTYNNIYYKGPMCLIEVPLSPLRVNFYTSLFKEPVATKEDLPLEGNELGDLRYIINNFYLFVWDGLEWDNPANFAAGDIEDLMTTFRAKRDAYLKSLNEVLLATKPFVWAAEYLPGYRLNKNTAFPSDFIPMFDIMDYVWSDIIGENESISLTTGNIQDMAITFNDTADAFIKAVYYYYFASYNFLTIEYRKELTNIYIEFLTNINEINEIPEGYIPLANSVDMNVPKFQFEDTSLYFREYWYAMLTGDRDLTYQLRPAYVSNLKAAMAAAKKLIEYSSGAPIIYTME